MESSGPPSSLSLASFLLQPLCHIQRVMASLGEILQWTARRHRDYNTLNQVITGKPGTTASFTPEIEYFFNIIIYLHIHVLSHRVIL